MKNTDDNQNDESVETQSFSDFFLELPFKIFMLVTFIIWLIGLGIAFLIVKVVK
jgi:hypothetical protein